MQNFYKKDIETVIEKFSFKKMQASPRMKPDNKDNIIIVPMLSEFGCETLGVVYCIPELLKTKWVGKYIIVVCWFGHEYFYKHLADEIWIMGEEHQYLKKYCKAFHHESKNLKRFEKEISKMGTLINVGEVSNVSVFPYLESCPSCKSGIMQFLYSQKCVSCGKEYSPTGLFSNPKSAKQRARWLQMPSEEAYQKVLDFIPRNAIGINARMRKTYGRNLSEEFYCKLILELENLGYSPVWFGDKASILPCPYKRIPDFSQSKLCSNLENTFALISQMKFTFQAYTASSRLSSMMGTPYIVVESPDQIWGIGQEGIRMNLLSKSQARKLIICQFLDAQKDVDGLLKLTLRGVEEIMSGDYSDIIGMVENRTIVENLKIKNDPRIGRGI